MTREFLQRLEGRARVAAGHCLSYGDEITFWPVVQVVKTLAGVSDTDDPQVIVERVGRLAGVDVGRDGEAELVRDRIAGLLGLAEAPSLPEETFWAVRRLVERHSDQPLVVIIEDIHWAEETLLDLIEYLVDRTRDAPILLLTLARPDIGEMRAGWGSGRSNAATIELRPLGDQQASALIDNLLGVPRTDPADEPWRQRVISAADGNPLFVEELVRMLVDDGSLRVEDGQCVAIRDLAEAEMPPTIEALISARIDRLPARRASGAGARGGDRQSLLLGRSGGANARPGPPGSRNSPSGAHAAGPDPGRCIRPPGRGRLPLPPRPRAGRRVQSHRQGSARRAT